MPLFLIGIKDAFESLHQDKRCGKMPRRKCIRDA